MNDSNLGIEQPSRPCTNQNSIHLPPRNGNVLEGKSAESEIRRKTSKMLEAKINSLYPYYK